MKKLISLVLAITISHLGLKSFLHHRLNNEVERFIEQAAPFATITYTGLSSSFLQKSFAIDNIKIVPNTHDTEFTIDKLRFVGANLFQSSQDWFENINLEEATHQAIEVEGLEIPLEHGTALNQLPPIGNTPSPNLNQLGYFRLKTDLTLSFETHPESNTFEVTYQQKHQDMLNIDLNATLVASLGNKTHIHPQLLAQSVQLVDAKMTFSNNVLFTKMMEHYAKDKGITVEQYKQEVVESLTQFVQEKELSLKQPHSKALVNMIENQSDIAFHIRPNQPMGIQTIGHLHLYKPSDVTQMLNLNITNPD